MARKPAEQSVSRDDIITAAAEVLRQKGYEATTMKDIAAQVNLTAASLYHHFDNKDALLLAVLEGGLDLVIGQIEPIVHSQRAHADKLSEMIRLHIAGVASNTAVGAAMVFEVRPLLTQARLPRGARARAAYQQRRDSFFARRDYFESLFRDVVQAGIDAGAFYPVDVPIFVKTLLGAQNWVGVWFREGGRLDGDTIARIMAATFLRALVKTPDC